MRRFRDQESTTTEVYLGDIVEQLSNLGELVDEVRRGQEPLELTDDRDHSRGETIYVFPRHITGIQRADNTTWIQVTGNRDYFVQENSRADRLDAAPRWEAAVVKALTLTQPWATLVAIGAKRIETRSWPTAYRGRLAIHAAKGFPLKAQQVCFRDPFLTVLHKAGFIGPMDELLLPQGVVVATCRLASCWQFDANTAFASSIRVGNEVIQLDERELEFGDFTSGRWGFVLTDIVAVTPPVEARGSLGLWNWEIPL